MSLDTPSNCFPFPAYLELINEHRNGIQPIILVLRIHVDRNLSTLMCIEQQVAVKSASSLGFHNILERLKLARPMAGRVSRM